MYGLYLKHKKIIYIFFILSLFILIFLKVNVTLKNGENYESNNWGNYYTVIKHSSFFIDSESDYSIYTLKEKKIIICDSKYDDEYLYLKNGRLFCWYVFDKTEEPISGWVEIKNMERFSDE